MRKWGICRDVLQRISTNPKNLLNLLEIGLSFASKIMNKKPFIKFFTKCAAIHKKCIFAAQSTTIKKYYGLQN